ncbi:AAA family ATPase [Ornithinibacillus salinisoli]|uniref:AAA family ATPase n=1 Tax=Ornithinibacillus salinisoli TaxID=1848459 RepID=A0ABW4VY15_9BACI
MKLLQATVHGFAKWVDFNVDFEKYPFTVIYGKNESGKSSLNNFILFMLFGLPPKMRTFYRPKTSSKMGGRLTIFDPNVGEFTIERMDETRNGAAICYTPDGKVYDENWLRERLNGMTLETYQSIFSFSALDLATIRSMKEENMGEVLLSIGLTGSSHINTIEKRLDNKLAELFKPYGKKPIINHHLQALQEQHRSLIDLQQEESTYRNKKTDILELTTEMNQVAESLHKDKEKEILLEKKLQALPEIHEYYTYSSQLADLPQDLVFPEDGINRLQALKEKVIPLQSEMSVLKTTEQKHRDQRSVLEKSLDEKQHYESASHILDRYTHYKENKKELNKLQAASQKLNLRIEAELRDLSIGLSSEDLYHLHFPYHIEKSWTDCKNSREQLKNEQKKLQEEEKLIENKQQYIEAQVQEIQGNLLPHDKRSLLEEKLNDYKENKILEKLKQEETDKEQKWLHNKRNTEKQTKTYLLLFTCIAIVAGITSFFMEAIVLRSIAVICILLGISQWIWSRRALKKMEKFLAKTSYVISQKPITDHEKDEFIQMLQRDEDNNKEQKSLHEQLKAIDIQHIQLDEKRTVYQENEKRLQGKILEQRELFPFLKVVDVTYWPEIYHALKNVLRMHQEKEELEKQAAHISNGLTTFTTEVEAFLKEENMVEIPNNLELQLRLIEEERNSIDKMKLEMQQIDQLLVENEKQQQELRQKNRIFEKEIHSLFIGAEVEDEDAYYKRANQLKQKHEWETLRERIVRKYQVIFSKDQWDDFLVETPKQSNLELELEQVREKKAEAEKKLHEMHQQLADIKADLINMESSDSYSKKIHQFHMQKEQVKEFAKEWAIYKTAKELLIETKRTYRNKYLSRVMEQTAEYFQEITGGTYINVYAPTADKLFLVEHKDHIRYTVNELSQGTIDQLYVSLRLAIGEVMTEKDKIPFIIDDAFVHFDAVRTDRVMKILAQIANKQQVILFSCKQEIMESRQANIIKLTNLVPLMENK